MFTRHPIKYVRQMIQGAKGNRFNLRRQISYFAGSRPWCDTWLAVFRNKNTRRILAKKEENKTERNSLFRTFSSNLTYLPSTCPFCEKYFGLEKVDKFCTIPHLIPFWYEDMKRFKGKGTLLYPSPREQLGGGIYTLLQVTAESW